MTASPRPGSRRDYRHFPEAYTSLLLAFDRDGRASLGPMSHADAKAGARDLYRFKMFLSQGCDDDPDDDHARSLLRIFAKIVLRVERVAGAEGACTHDAPTLASPSPSSHASHVINLSLNPIVAAMERKQ